MHERSTKKEHIDTVLYEIDMLRYCALALPEKQACMEKSEFARAEYYLVIEGFLLHLRNLIAFFTNRSEKPTDLVINKPTSWAGEPINQREYSDLIKRTKQVNKAHGVTDSDCHDQISKYLQHCTTLRYERAKSWDIEKIFGDLDPVLLDFEKRFAPGTGKSTLQTKGQMRALGGANNSTASFTR